MHDRVLVIACGALAREIRALRRNYGWRYLHLKCLDPLLHNRPDRIADRLREAIERHRSHYNKIFVGYADCGTAGAIDKIIDAYGIERLPGAHCYQFFAGPNLFEELTHGDPGTFYLTDFLARNFTNLVVKSLKLNEHPDHIALYFGNYSRVVYLSQNPDDELMANARDAAKALGLHFEHFHCGYGELQGSLELLMSGRPDGQNRPHFLA